MANISINSTNDAVNTTVTINGKEFAAIPITLLNPENKWQRSLKTAKAKRKIAMLIKNWDDNQCRPVTVIYNEKNGNYDVIDGGHRVEAAREMGKESLVAEIIRFNGTEEEKEMYAAWLFTDQGTATDHLTPAEKHKANLLRKVPENMTLELAASKHGFILKNDGSRGYNKAKKNFVCGFTKALKFAKYCPIALNYTFDVIDAMHWNEERSGLSAWTINMIGKVFAYHPGREDDIARAMVDVLENMKPLQAFAEAAVEYKGRSRDSANLMWLEGKVCNYLNIERKYHGQKIILGTIVANVEKDGSVNVKEINKA